MKLPDIHRPLCFSCRTTVRAEEDNDLALAQWGVGQVFHLYSVEARAWNGRLATLCGLGSPERFHWE